MISSHVLEIDVELAGEICQHLNQNWKIRAIKAVRQRCLGLPVRPGLWYSKAIVDAFLEGNWEPRIREFPDGTEEVFYLVQIG